MARSPLIAIILLAGCASTPPPVTVNIPIPVRVVPPPELLEPLRPPSGVFVPPGDPRAIVGITEAGRGDLVSYVDALRQRLAAWTAWAVDDTGPPPDP